MQKEMQPQFDLLYSQGGFCYCDWLLAPAEHGARRRYFKSEISNLKSEISDCLAEVERRATTTLKWMIDNKMNLLDIALDHLSLARKHLAEAQQIAERGPMPLFLADIHLHRARMFHDKTELAQAAKLIRPLAYGRRYDELLDAEQALR